jgi:hypothetical protein
MHLQLLEGSGQKGSDNNRNICDAVAHHQDMKHDVMDAFRTLEWGRQGLHAVWFPSYPNMLMRW